MVVPPNTNPQNVPPAGVNANQLRDSLRDLLDDQGDYNNLLRDSIRQMGSLDSSYAKILSRIKSP